MAPRSSGNRDHARLGIAAAQPCLGRRIGPAMPDAPRLRQRLRALAGTLVLLPALQATAADAGLAMYRCRFEDGVVRKLPVQPDAFPMAMRDCVAEGQNEPVRPGAYDAPPLAPGPATTWIEPLATNRGRAGARAPVVDLSTYAALVIEAPETSRGYAGVRPSAVDLSAHAALVQRAGDRYALSPRLIDAVIRAESAGRAQAISPRGAIGLMQVMPSTGRQYGVLDPNALKDPAVNIDVGAHYLSDLARQFPGRTDLVVAAYNAGAGAVISHGGRVPPFDETRNYVIQVMAALRNPVPPHGRR